MSTVQRFFLALFLINAGLTALATPVADARAPEAMTISGKQFLINGQPLTVKGVNYHPTPNTGLDNWGNDWTLNPALVANDFLKMKEMGANTVRIYVKYEHLFKNWDNTNPGEDAPDVKEMDKYRAVLAKADELGIYVIMNYQIPGSLKFMSAQDRDWQRIRFRKMINAFMDRTEFPMILMWAFGNENNLEAHNPAFSVEALFDYYQWVIADAKTLDSGHKYTVVIGDHPDKHIYNQGLLDRAPAVDVWSLNIYNTEQGFRNIIQGYPLNKPLLFSEFGNDACLNNAPERCGSSDVGTQAAQQNQADFYKSRWDNVMKFNLSSENANNKLLGGIAFEWNDEWWKSDGGDAARWTVHNWEGRANPNISPDFYLNEEWLGLATALPEGATSGRTYRLAYYELQRMWNAAPAPQVANASFDADNAWTQQPQGWSTWSPNGTEAADFAEAHGGSRTGAYHGTHYSASAYHVFTYQTLTGIPNGVYALRAWVRSTGGQLWAEMHAKDFDNTVDFTNPANIRKYDIDAAGALNTWTPIQIENIPVTNGQLTLGFISNAPAYTYLYFEDVQVVRQ
jgi:hypothetical protein